MCPKYSSPAESVKDNIQEKEKNSGLAFKKSQKAKKPFTIIDRSFMQLTGSELSDLSFRIICYLMSLPEDWEVRMSQLRDHIDVGKDKLQAAMRELVEKGYIRRQKERAEDGKFSGWITEYSDIPEFLADNTQIEDVKPESCHESNNVQCLKNRLSENTDVRKNRPYIINSDLNILNTTTSEPKPEDKPDKVVVDFDNELISELQSYGIYPDTAKLFVKEHPEPYLRSKIAFVNDYKKQGKKIEDMGSLLYQAIVKNWTAVKNDSPSSSAAETIDQYVARKNSESVRLEMEKEVKRGALVEKLGLQHLSRELQDEKIEAYQEQIAKNALASMKGRLREGFPCNSVGDLVGVMS